VKKITIQRTGQQKELLKCKIKDKTGVLPVSLWGKTAAQLAGVKVGDCVHIKKGERGTFEQKPCINTWEDSTTVEVSAFIL